MSIFNHHKQPTSPQPDLEQGSQEENAELSTAKKKKPSFVKYVMAYFDEETDFQFLQKAEEESVVIQPEQDVTVSEPVAGVEVVEELGSETLENSETTKSSKPSKFSRFIQSILSQQDDLADNSASENQDEPVETSAPAVEEKKSEEVEISEVSEQTELSAITLDEPVVELGQEGSEQPEPEAVAGEGDVSEELEETEHSEHIDKPSKTPFFARLRQLFTPKPKPAPVTGLLADLAEAEQWAKENLAASGYQTAYNLSSIIDLERFFQTESQDEGVLTQEDRGIIVFAVGAYLGEIFVKACEGEWVVDDQDPQGELNVHVALPDGRTFYPVKACHQRLTHPELGSLTTLVTQFFEEVPQKTEQVDEVIELDLEDLTDTELASVEPIVEDEQNPLQAEENEVN